MKVKGRAKERGFWNSIERQKNFIQELSKNLKKDIEKLTNKEIISNGGAGLLGRYRNNLPLTFSSLFPHFNPQLKLKNKKIVNNNNNKIKNKLKRDRIKFGNIEINFKSAKIL